MTSRDTAKAEWTYRVPLDPPEPDPFYAARSSWCFYAEPEDSNAFWVDYFARNPGAASAFAGSMGTLLKLTVVAHRDAMPT